MTSVFSSWGSGGMFQHKRFRKVSFKPHGLSSQGRPPRRSGRGTSRRIQVPGESWLRTTSSWQCQPPISVRWRTPSRCFASGTRWCRLWRGWGLSPSLCACLRGSWLTCRSQLVGALCMLPWRPSFFSTACSGQPAWWKRFSSKTRRYKSCYLNERGEICILKKQTQPYPPTKNWKLPKCPVVWNG